MIIMCSSCLKKIVLFTFIRFFSRHYKAVLMNYLLTEPTCLALYVWLALAVVIAAVDRSYPDRWDPLLRLRSTEIVMFRTMNRALISLCVNLILNQFSRSVENQCCEWSVVSATYYRLPFSLRTLRSVRWPIIFYGHTYSCFVGWVVYYYCWIHQSDIRVGNCAH